MGYLSYLADRIGGSLHNNALHRTSHRTDRETCWPKSPKKGDLWFDSVWLVYHKSMIHYSLIRLIGKLENGVSVLAKVLRIKRTEASWIAWNESKGWADADVFESHFIPQVESPSHDYWTTNLLNLQSYAYLCRIGSQVVGEG